MCLIALLLLFSARLADVVWWIAEPNRWDRAFNGSWVWPVLGIIFLPWTTLMWVIVAPTGNPEGFDWLWLGIAVFGDLATYSGSGYGNRDKVPGYTSY
jgi:hypothetical protein